MNRYLYLGLLFALISPRSLVAQVSGKSTGWCHNRDGSVSPCVDGGGLVVEREIVVIQGPPIIVWKAPSAEGSAQAEFAGISDPAVKRELDDFSQTSWMLYNKGKRAAARGEVQKAAAYFEAARGRNPSLSELSDIDLAFRALFDGHSAELNAPFKFHKTYHAMALPAAIFKTDRKDLEPLRQELLPMLVEQQNALTTIRNLDPGTASEKETTEAQAKLDTAQKAIENKIEAAKKIYQLD